MSKKKATITRSINRKINTAQYESIDIHVGRTEEIEWETEEERKQQIDDITDSLVLELLSIIEKTANGLGVNKKLATKRNNLNPKNIKKSDENVKDSSDNKSINNSTDNDYDDFDFLEG